MVCKVKICGITNREDLNFIARAGADYGGLLIEIDSIRAHSLEEAKQLIEDPPLPLVAVTLDRNEEENKRIVDTICPAAIQLHGFESPHIVSYLRKHISCEIWKVMHLTVDKSEEQTNVDSLLQKMNEYANAGADRFIVDAAIMDKGQQKLGGTGKNVDWKTARVMCEKSPRPFILAGGIHPGNVVEAIRKVHPFGIDLSSGVEMTKGKKDPDKILKLISSVRAFQSPEGGFRNNPVC